MSTTDEERTLAATQLEAGDQDVRMPEDKRAETTKDKEGRVKITVPFRDEKFEVAETVGYWELMEWAASSEEPVDSPAGLIAVYHMLKAVVHEDDFASFNALARSVRPKPEPEELLDFINSCMEAIAGRPTEASESSEATSSRTSGASKVKSTSARAKGSRR